jgi:hypothetical protein
VNAAPLRPLAERLAGVRLLVRAAGTVWTERSCWAPAIAAATGLSREGVELGFACLEHGVTEDDIRALVATTPETEQVHVVLSANVFTAPLRALAVARAAAALVTVRASPRDPVLTEALVLAAGDPAVRVVSERDVARTEASEVHVYGRDETVAAVKARVRSGVVVRSHGAGLGVAFVSSGADVAGAAAAIAADVVPFDQRGCLSPRVVLVEGDPGRASRLGSALHEELAQWGERVPRGRLFEQERAEATRWIDTLAFAETVWRGDAHAVALSPAGAALVLGPAGRHVLVASCPSRDDLGARIAPLARFIVAIGTDDLSSVRPHAPPHVRLSLLGRMQRPPLDGSVDLRATETVSPAPLPLPPRSGPR